MLVIETDRLILREYAESDWKSVHEYAKNEDVLIYEIWGPNTEAQTKGFIKKAIEDSQKIPRLAFELCIVLKTNLKLIGGCGIRIKPNNSRRCDFGYIINPAHWNNGYATEASKALINYMVKNHGIAEIEATSDSLNIASIKVLKKCGLNLIKVIKNDREIKGSIRDTCFFEMKIED